MPNVYQQFLLGFIASRLIRPFLSISLNNLWDTDVRKKTDGKYTGEYNKSPASSVDFVYVH